MKLTTGGKKDVLSDCRRVTPVLARIGDKWTVLVIAVLRHGPQRFNELKRSVDGISQQMLTRTLKGLERDGMVTRTTFPTTPPQVQYELSELGKSLSAPVLALGKWAFEHLAEIDEAQRKYDRHAGG
ncbi:winged helix-turn-helix transcriptional regulator [Burkholderia cenocepacia]|uniref:winged helix-turn-helix transcriptional regulator n=1 Tax=Burkholderia cenocepacia TaxID=95486 RepID=UPI002AB62D34|nr:helix-turn-helix domain-containing protein [Burkholderia cenocepacia]